MKNRISIGYQWFYDLDMVSKKVITGLVGSCQLQKSKKESSKLLKDSFKLEYNNEYTDKCKEAATYELVLIKRKQIKRNK